MGIGNALSEDGRVGTLTVVSNSATQTAERQLPTPNQTLLRLSSVSAEA